MYDFGTLYFGLAEVHQTQSRLTFCESQVRAKHDKSELLARSIVLCKLNTFEVVFLTSYYNTWQTPSVI